MAEWEEVEIEAVSDGLNATRVSFTLHLKCQETTLRKSETVTP